VCSSDLSGKKKEVLKKVLGPFRVGTDHHQGSPDLGPGLVQEIGRRRALEPGNPEREAAGQDLLNYGLKTGAGSAQSLNLFIPKLFIHDKRQAIGQRR
jgi:hypothetical protein